MPMRVAACNRDQIGILFPYFLGHVTQTSRGKVMPMRVVACNRPRWHTCPLLCLGHVGQTNEGKVCQCVLLRAATRIGILLPYLSGPCGPDK